MNYDLLSAFGIRYTVNNIIEDGKNEIRAIRIMSFFQLKIPDIERGTEK